jgi:hypothetical protein
MTLYARGERVPRLHLESYRGHGVRHGRPPVDVAPFDADLSYEEFLRLDGNPTLMPDPAGSSGSTSRTGSDGQSEMGYVSGIAAPNQVAGIDAHHGGVVRDCPL